MRIRCITAVVTGAFLAVSPVFVQAQTAPATITGAHVIVTDGSSQHELTADSAQVAHSEVSGMNAGKMMSTMGAEIALSAASVVAGPIAAIASPIISMFGHHAQPKPTMHMLLALPGSSSPNALSNDTPSFTVDYSDIAGINPDAYTPELVQLTQTKDNWRVVAASESSELSSVHQAPKITESKVDYANVTVASPGHATIAVAHALSPGEYGIVLRPSTPGGEVAPASLFTVWDFTIRS